MSLGVIEPNTRFQENGELGQDKSPSNVLLGMSSFNCLREILGRSHSIYKQILLRVVKQAIYLYVSQLLLIVIGFVTVTLNTRLLGPSGYGIVSFVLTVLEFVGLFFKFGFFETSKLLLAHEHLFGQQKELIGASTVIGFITGLFFAGFMFFASYFIDSVFRTNCRYILDLVWPLIVFLPYQILIPQIAAGTNRITFLSVFYLIPKVTYLIGLIIVLLLGSWHVDPKLIVLMNLMSVGVGVAWSLIYLRPSFNRLRDSLMIIWKKNREYGIHMYLGQLIDKASYKTDGLLITYFTNPIQLGFYALAGVIASPVLIFSQSISTALFRELARESQVHRRFILLNLIWLLVSTAFVIVLGPFCVALLFGTRFQGVQGLLWPMALTVFFQGLYAPYNSFLGAKGKARWLKRISVLQAVFNVIGNAILICLYGAWGAAVASMIAAFIAYLGHEYYYHQEVNQKGG